MTSAIARPTAVPESPAPAQDPLGPALAERWARELSGQDPDAVIRFAHNKFGQKLAVSTQFGLEGCNLVHRVSVHAPSAVVFTIDTGLLFEETYRLAERLERRCGIVIRRVKPEHTVGEQAAYHGPNLWERDPDLCCTLRKVAPMQEALKGCAAWMTAIRRGQSETRSETPVVSWDARFQVVKFAPLATHSAEQIQQYIDEHQVPTNPLRVLGYRSLGCFPCTRPVQEGEDERAGRWSGRTKTECGIHKP